jgi:hypothetical protein
MPMAIPMGLSGADWTDEGEVLGVIDEGAGRQLPDHGRVDAVAGIEVELGEGLVLGEAGLADSGVDGRCVTAEALGAEHVDEELAVAGALGFGVTNDLVELAGESGHLEGAEVGSQLFVQHVVIDVVLHGVAPRRAS